MEDHLAVEMLSALAHEHRIKIFRLLVIAGPSGVPSSDIAAAIGISPTGASFRLKELGSRPIHVSATVAGRKREIAKQGRRKSSDFQGLATWRSRFLPRSCGQEKGGEMGRRKAQPYG
ncbi:MAG: helix-turn-helix domain-containing protein [Hyphomicrobiales bacterium]|nr:helix-turn-helix domain-containing protein [Hyphomicrobiales bacterium]